MKVQISFIPECPSVGFGCLLNCILFFKSLHHGGLERLQPSPDLHGPVCPLQLESHPGSSGSLKASFQTQEDH